jgi:hypothetical protein
MKYLVQMKLANSSRPATPLEGVAFIEQFILPTLELCKRLEAERTILAGGPASGAVALALIVRAESIEELDDLITGLPGWPRMESPSLRSPALRAACSPSVRGLNKSRLRCRQVPQCPTDDEAFFRDGSIANRPRRKR